MSAGYELWETESGNMILCRETKREILAVVRAYMTKHGPAAVDSWALFSPDSEGDVGELFTGSDLADRAAKDLRDDHAGAT